MLKVLPQFIFFSWFFTSTQSFQMRYCIVGPCTSRGTKKLNLQLWHWSWSTTLIPIWESSKMPIYYMNGTLLFLNFYAFLWISSLFTMGSSVFWQLEFRHRALSAYGTLSIGILAYGILTMLLLAYSILAISVSWHIQIKITA